MIATIIIAALIAAYVGFVIIRRIQKRKNGEAGCGCGCGCSELPEDTR
ncbi:FeoB-associated Cys-rich membrane protein [Lacrimispora sp.]